MSLRATRWLWFIGLFILLPWPVPVFGEPFVPAVRYAILGAAAAAVAVFEGGSGPVAMIVGFFTGMTLATALGCWLLALAAARAMRGMPANARAALTLIALVLGLVCSLVFEPYRTPFGRAVTGGLLEILS